MSFYNVELGDQWTWVVLLPLLLAVPLVFWRGHRLAYAAGVAGILMAMLAALWLRNWNSAEQTGVRLVEVTPGAVSSKSVGILAKHGGIRLLYSDQANHMARTIALSKSGVILAWDRTANAGDQRYPSMRWPTPLVVNWAGIQAGVYRGVDDPSGVAELLTCEVVMPDWFAMLTLATVPAWWRCRRSMLQAYVRKNNLCAACGYCLHGLAEPVRCPECGRQRVTSEAPRMATSYFGAPQVSI